MEKNSNTTVKQNYIYNVIFQIFALITVFITTPYVTRVLGAEGIGIYSYTYSIATYFILIGSLGISLYGQREIAYFQNDKHNRSKCFFEILSFRVIMLLLTIIFFYVFFCNDATYGVYYKLLIFELIGSGIDIIWLYQGMEDFKKIVIRNIIIRFICTILIFIFVKSSQDLWIYFLILSLSTFLGNLSLWIDLPKYIELVDYNEINIKKHVKPILLLFAPQIAIKVYTVLDKTMIGYITNNMSYVGIYQKVQEIVNLGMTVVTSFGAVIFPRIANNFINNRTNNIKQCINESFSFVWLIGLPLTLGLMACSNNFVQWYLGPDFYGSGKLLMLFSLIIMSVGLNNVVGMQYLIATKHQREFTIAVSIGAISNVIGNYFLIKYFNVPGAIVSSIIAETLILIIELFYMKDVIKNNANLKLMIKCLFSSLIMFVATYYVGLNMNATIFTTLIQILVGVSIYFLILIFMREPIVINNISLVLKRLRRK